MLIFDNIFSHDGLTDMLMRGARPGIINASICPGCQVPGCQVVVVSLMLIDAYKK
jgi:hypothetical protein